MAVNLGIGRLILVLFFAILMTGCSSNNDVSKTASDSSSAAKEGGTLVIARLSDAENLDQQFMSTINAASVTHHKIYEGLVQRDKNGDIQPMLAKSWKQIDDTTWEFKLREDVTFHDGTPFNADAVKKTFDRLLDPAVASPRAFVFEMVQEVKPVDEYTVQFKLKEPFSPLLSILANHEGGIISPKTIEKYGKKIIQEPSGTGPFVFDTWSPGQEITLVKNKAYWGNEPKVDKVIFKVVPEDSTRISMIETGEAQIAEPLPIAVMDQVESSAAMDVYRSEGYGTEYLGFNVKNEPFNDVRVRKAIAHATEMDSIIKGVFNNVGVKANSLMGSKVFGYDASLEAYDYNLKEAKKLMAEAGYSKGLNATILTMDSKERVNLAEVLQSQLKGIGINLKVQVMEYGSFVEQVNKGQSEMFIISWRNATGDADYNQYNLFHTNSQGAAGNTFFYSNQKVDNLIDAARKEKVEEKRKELYAEAQEIEMADTPYIPVRVIENMAAVAKDVKGFSISPSGYLEINEVTIK
ncbi:glutathione ABC transporter substrate-binding protein [Peribacillus sp. SI8-4]|uniref:glutathione ABC transporter substrate-binding protein n=1 Tax=Peribacillus sp. SI8-4 TaxID=3048009 RepID=UPI002557AC3D|nr:glutathione ABC transporter substrate-binding protein [Peribacillus sp. SI8-4]